MAKSYVYMAFNNLGVFEYLLVFASENYLTSAFFIRNSPCLVSASRSCREQSIGGN